MCLGIARDKSRCFGDNTAESYSRRDACSNMMGLGWSLGYEDFEQGKRSLRKLAALDFDVACFGHGKAIQKDAARKFKQKWA